MSTTLLVAIVAAVSGVGSSALTAAVTLWLGSGSNEIDRDRMRAGLYADLTDDLQEERDQWRQAARDSEATRQALQDTVEALRSDVRDAREKIEELTDALNEAESETDDLRQDLDHERRRVRRFDRYYRLALKKLEDRLESGEDHELPEPDQINTPQDPPDTYGDSGSGAL